MSQTQPQFFIGEGLIVLLYTIVLWFYKLYYENHVKISEPTSSCFTGENYKEMKKKKKAQSYFS